MNRIAKTPKYAYNKCPNKKMRPFTERNGDWTCKNCRNLNFAFRTECNRCKLPKKEALEDSNNKDLKKENELNIKNTPILNTSIKNNNINNNSYPYKFNYQNKNKTRYKDNFQYNNTENKNFNLNENNTKDNCKDNEDK